MRRVGRDVRRFVCSPMLGKGSRLPRRSLFAIGNENGIHRKPRQGVNIFAPADQACNRQGDKTPISREFVGTGLVFASVRLVVGVFANIEDQRLGLGCYALDSPPPEGQPG